MRVRFRTFGILMAASLALVGCEVEDPAGEGADIVEDSPDEGSPEDQPDDGDGDEGDAAEETEEPAEDEERPAGTRENPVALGTRVDLGEWQVTISEVVKDAGEQVLAENQFNEPPAEGRQYVMWTVEATYNGEESGTAWLDLSFGLVGAQGNTFGTSMDDRCGSIPNSLQDEGETFPGGTVTGNECASVPAEQIEGGTIFVENSLSFDSNRAFFAIP